MPPAYLYNAPAGVEGDISRVDESSVEPAMLIAVSSVYAQKYGIAMVYASGGISQNGAGFAAADFAGVLARSAPQIMGSTASGFDNNVPNPDQVQNLLVRGYISVKCVYGTPARGGLVYVRTVADTGKAVGDFDATSDSGKNVVLSLTQATWASDGKDGDNNAELRVYR